MSNTTPNPMKRSHLLAPGCKDLIDVLEGPKSKHSLSTTRVNGKIKAREVRVVGERGEQLGIMPLVEALRLAQTRRIDLVEIAPRAKPPICRVMDYGKYRHELSKRRTKKK